MGTEQHELCVEDWSMKISQIASLDFPAYGNIYFADAPIREDLKVPLEDGFCIGPFCSPLYYYWNCTPEVVALLDGPSPSYGPCIDIPLCSVLACFLTLVKGNL
jgi:hypothetical protein